MITQPKKPFARFNPRAIKPTDEQSAIQINTHKVILIEANAGAAKTTTLALRIAESLARGVPAEKILCLVFTPEAAIALRNCLSKIGVQKHNVDRLSIYTFEMFAKRMLEIIEGGRVQYLPSPEALKPMVIEAMERVFEKYADAFELDTISIGMTNVAVDEFLHLQLRIKAKMELCNGDFDDLSVEDIAESVLGITPTLYILLREYERSRVVDVDDVVFRGRFDACYDLVRRLETYPDNIHGLPEFQMVIADELHDLNEATFRLLSIFINRGKVFFCGAGDKDQVIYSWAGADHQYLQSRFKGAFPALQLLPLTSTFRYGPHLAEPIAAFKKKKNTSALLVKTDIEVLGYGGETGVSCADRVVEAITQWAHKKANGSVGSAAILIRSPFQSIAIENALLRTGLPYKPERMLSYLQRPEILFLRGVLSTALNNLGSIKDPTVIHRIVDALVTFAEIDLSGKDHNHYEGVKQAQADLTEQPDFIPQFFKHKVQDNSRNAAVKDAIGAALHYLEQSPPDAPAGDVLREVFEILKLEDVCKRIFVSRSDAEDVTKSLRGFIQASHDSGKNLRDFSFWLNATEKALFSQKWQDTITLCLIDNAKGLEFDHVIIPYLSADEFPKLGHGKLEEENRFYVAATRTKLKLTLITPEPLNLRSRFVGEMQIDKLSKTGDRMLRSMGNMSPDVSAEKTYLLNAGFQDYPEAKDLGACNDPARKLLFVPAGRDLRPFQKWIR